MENKTSYSLQDAKGEVAVKAGYFDWLNLEKRLSTSINETDNIICMYQDQAAELYKEKATEVLIETHRLQSEDMLSDIVQLTGEKEELRKENEALKVWSEKQNVFIDNLGQEITRLKESNKEMVEALKDLHESTLYKLSPNDPREDYAPFELFDKVEKLLKSKP
jgi:uncharacterized protein YgfB (UPF0149 family)